MSDIVYKNTADFNYYDTENFMLNKNIKFLRESNNLSQVDLGKIVDKERSAVSLWERNERNLSIKDMVKISNYFNVSIDNLIKHDLELESTTLNSNKSVFNSTKIPVFKDIPNYIVLKETNDLLGWEPILDSWLDKNQEYFGVRINDNSMEPDYKIDDIVIFEKVFSYDYGKDYIVKVGNANPIFTRVNKQQNGILLQSLNSNYDTKFYTDKEIEKLPITIIGVAKEIRRKAKD